MSSLATSKLAKDPGAKALAGDTRVKFAVDHGPTEPGYDWYCNGCPFVTVDFEEAIAHAIDARDHHAFAHMLYEKSGDSPPRRRIATYIDGYVQAEVSRRASKPEAKKPAAKPAARRRRG